MLTNGSAGFAVAGDVVDRQTARSPGTVNDRQVGHTSAFARSQSASCSSLLQLFRPHELRPMVRAPGQHPKDHLRADDRGQVAAQRAVNRRGQQQPAGCQVRHRIVHKSRHVVNVFNHFQQQQDIEALSLVQRGIGRAETVIDVQTSGLRMQACGSNIVRRGINADNQSTVSNGMDAPTRNGINVPKWRPRINNLNLPLTERGVHHEDYDNWH